MRDDLVFHPDRAHLDPTTLPPGASVVATSSSDEPRVQGWWLPPADTDAPVAVLFHGNAGDHGDRAVFLRRAARCGHGALVAGYRGYGGNPGAPSPEGLRADARAWIAWLTADAGISAARVHVHGRSIGTAFAAHAAARHDVASLVLAAPFSDLANVARHASPLGPEAELVFHGYLDIRDDLDRIETPTTVIVGLDDGVIPADLGIDVAARIGAETDLIELPGARHADVPPWAPKRAASSAWGACHTR